MQGNHVVVLSSLIASELAVKSAFQAAVQATSPWVALCIVLVAIFAMSHQVQLVLPLLRQRRRHHPSSWSQSRLLVARLLRVVVKFIEPPRQGPVRRVERRGSRNGRAGR